MILHGRAGIRILSSVADSISTSERYSEHEPEDKIRIPGASGHVISWFVLSFKTSPMLRVFEKSEEDFLPS